MTVRERISQQLGTLTESELEQVAQYVTFLRFKARSQNRTTADEAELAALYQDAADEDQDLAEAGMTDYVHALVQEDTK